jgi:hypothetical protein
MLAILGAMGHGFTGHENKVYNAWWKELRQGRGHTESGWKKGKVKWAAINMNEENLVKFAQEHLRREPDHSVPLLIHILNVELNISKDQILQMMKDYLARGETAEEYVRLWWALIEKRAADFEWLTYELQTAEWDASDLRKALFRSAGRNRSRHLCAVTEHFQTGQLGEAFATLLRIGFVFTTDIREILRKRFQKDPYPKECVRALKAIGEHRATTFAAHQKSGGNCY